MRIKILVLAALLLVLLPASIGQWNDCPSGMVECTQPCGQYIDTDGSGVCDRSEQAPREETSIITASAASTAKNGLNERYPFIFPALSLLLLYLLSTFVFVPKLYSRATHKMAWNVLLLFAFLLAAVLGIVLVLRLNYGWNIDPPFRLLFWHVEFGIVFAMVALFHFLWHLNYFGWVLRRIAGKK